MFPHQAMQDRLVRPTPLVLDRVRRRGTQHGLRSSPIWTQTREPRSRGTATWQVPEKANPSQRPAQQGRRRRDVRRAGRAERARARAAPAVRVHRPAALAPGLRPAGHGSTSSAASLARRAIDPAGGDTLLVGRAECFLVGRPDLEETIARLNDYAGADCPYAPGIRTHEQIAAVVAGHTSAESRSSYARDPTSDAPPRCGSPSVLPVV